MEVVAAAVDAGGGGGGDGTAPFARRDVREWSRLDRATGAREHARVESDRWTARSAAGQRAYGKVVDSRVRNAADGRAQAHSRRQLEVFRQQGPQGSFQLVRTSTTSVSSSSSSGAAGAAAAAARLQLAFDNLQLPLNPLDVGPQRTRASVGRSGSISARRPPSRQPRSPAATTAIGASTKSPEGVDHPLPASSKAAATAASAASDADAEVDSLTAQVSRICRQLHAEAHRAAFGPSAARLLADASASGGDESDAGVVIEELSDSDAGCSDGVDTAATGETKAPSTTAAHAPATRRRSSSIEDLKAEEGTAVEDSPAWSRASQVRRSLQFPSKIQDRESSPSTRPLSSRLFAEDNKLFEGGKLKSLEAFENIFRRGANIAESVNKSMTHDREDSDASNSDSLANHLRSESVSKNMEAFMRRTSNGTSASNAAKRHSFVTVESLKEVRGRLRPLNSPSDEEPKQIKNIFKSSKDEEDNDDGIVTDDHIKHPDSESGSEMPPSKVKSYILGMEVLANNNNRNGTRKPVLGTGSLESRTSSRTSSNGNNRSEEWYNRRKSYGFEQVHSQDTNDNTRPNRLWEKNKVESSTDSGICRSSEAVSGPPWNRTSPTKIEEGKTFDFRKSDNLLKVSHNIQIKKQDDKEKILEDSEKEEESAYQRGRKTIVTLGNEFKKSNSSYKPAEDGSITVHNSIIKDNSVSLNGYRNSSEDEHKFKPLAGPGSSRRQSEPVTITIPIVSDETEKETGNVESKRLFFRQLSAGTSLSIESSDKKSAFTNGSAIKDNFKRGTWNGGDEWTKSIDNEMKRHSIAVDESKYVREGIKRFSNLHDSASKELANVSTSELVKRFAAMHGGKKDEGIFSNKDKYNPVPTGFNVSFVQNGEGFSTDDQNKKHKKVEFCKTEVHFAAESGRVNIVETDEKPPPSNPIRRRRRNSAGSITTALPTPDPNKSNLPEIRFGDSPYEKQLLGGNEISEPKEPVPSPPSLIKPEPTRPTVLSIGAFQKDAEKEDPVYPPASSAIASTISQECAVSSYDESLSEHVNITTHSSESMPRSILKNNRKPKPFILGASNDSTLESSDNQDEKWGVKLRPVQPSGDNSSTAMWRSTVTLRSTAFDTPQQPLTERKDDPLIMKQSQSNTETELQKMLRQLRPAGQRKSTSETDSNCSPQSSPVAAKKTVSESPNNSVQVTISSPMTDSLFSGWSVADRVKQVEEMKHTSMETKGYSTRINFGSGEATIVESGSSDDQQSLNLKHTGPSLFQKSDKCKPMWLRREEKKQELQVGSEPPAEETARPHVTMANAVVPSYDPNKLRRVETLVSTRSGQPKITSIALRYEGDQSEERSRSKTSSFSTSTYSQHQSAWKNLEPAPSHSYLPPRSDEKIAVGFTYYKPKEGTKEQPTTKDDRRDRTYKIDKHKNLVHSDEKMSRQKVSPSREPLFSTDRRSDSPTDTHRRSMSPPSKRQIGYSSPKQSSSPVAPFEPERERSLSPSSKSHSKPTTYFGDLNARSNSAFSSPYRQESPKKSSKSYDQKNESTSHQRSQLNSVTTHQRSQMESSRTHSRTVPETNMNGPHSGVVETSAREERRRYTYESSSRSRSASRGRSLSPSKSAEPRKSQAPEPEGNDYDSPIYENIDDILEESPAVTRAETNSAILEELTRAADQILQAVNGYTDEDSRASSDDDDSGRRNRRGRRGGRPAERMTTIAEAPAARRVAGPPANGSASAAASRRAHQQRLAHQCSRLAAHNSSTSSIESLTRAEAAPRRVGATAAAATGARALLRRERLAVEEARRKVTSGPAAAATGASKPSSRTARLLQRASSREMLLKAHASSSEDVMSGAETAAAEALAARKARAPRRLRAASSAAAAAKSSSLTSASSGGRRPSPAVAGPQQPLTAAGRPRRREADVPKSKERSHGVRSEEIRRRSSSRREDGDVTRTRGVRAAGPLHQHPTSSALITSSSGRERGASGQRRSAGATRAPSAAAAGSSSAAAVHAAASAGTATGPSHAVARKPSSSRTESLSYSNKISK